MNVFKGIPLALVLCCYIPVSGQQQADSTAYDFWVGDWEVSWYGQDSTLVTGSNRIEKILDNKVLQEHFEDPTTGFKGTSLSVYNPGQGTWHQAWADNSGGYIDMVGEIVNGNPVFRTVKEGPNGGFYRMVFSDIGPESFTWTWEGTRDEGVTWTTAWQIFYKRK